MTKLSSKKRNEESKKNRCGEIQQQKNVVDVYGREADSRERH